MSEPLTLCEAPNLAPVPGRGRRLDIVERGDDGRVPLERFVETRFHEAFGAEIHGHYPVLASLNGLDGEPRAVAGVRFAEAGPLFLERYLDAPVEGHLAHQFHTEADRGAIAEIGSLASVSAPATLELFASLAGWLSTVHGRRFAVATVRPELARLLSRAGFCLHQLGAADPARVENADRTWGSYYHGAPAVFAGEIRVPAPLGLIRARRDAAPMRELRRAAS